MALIEPVFRKLGEVAYIIRRDIKRPHITDPTKFVNLLTPVVEVFREVETKKLDKEAVQVAGRVAEALEMVLEKKRRLKPIPWCVKK